MPSLLGNPALWVFTQARVLVFMLTIVRLTGLLATMPGFGQARVVLQARVALVVLLAAIITPLAGAPRAPVETMWDLTGLMFTEFVAGLLMGLAVSWIVDMVSFAGQLMDTQMGFSFVQFLDPVSSHPVAVSGSLLNQVTMLLILVSGLHHQMIRALVESYRILPMGGTLAINPQVVVIQMGQILVKGFQLAFPVLFTLFIVDFIAGIAGKFMPQLHLITLTFPLKIAIGLILLGIILREFAPWVAPLLEAAPREALRMLVSHG
ncbi:MAG: flagellar biosynthetic protein FliR [Holophaga sp.]|nr:flagellar biosynthetic protein FliR [Holophaga sp.]